MHFSLRLPLGRITLRFANVFHLQNLIMNTGKIIVAICALVGSSANMHAQGSNPSRDAATILANAYKIRASAETYYYETESKPQANQSIIVIKTYERHLPDGTIERRVESGTKDSNEQRIEITNKDGVFQLLKDKAVDISFQESDFGSVYQNLNLEQYQKVKGYEFELEETDLNQKKCHKITMTLNAAGRDAARKMFASLGAAPSESLPEKTVCYVEDESGELVREEAYNASGDKVRSISFLNINRNFPVKADLFKVPEGMPIVVVKDWAEYAHLIAQDKISQMKK
jgi:outer membrane lipoprotein-sorting protein